MKEIENIKILESLEELESYKDVTEMFAPLESAARINNDEKFAKSGMTFYGMNEQYKEMKTFPSKTEKSIDIVLRKYGIEKYSILNKLFKELQLFTNDIVKKFRITENFGEYCSALDVTYMLELHMLIEGKISTGDVIMEILKDIPKKLEEKEKKKECEKELLEIIESIMDSNIGMRNVDDMLLDMYNLRPFTFDD